MNCNYHPGLSVMSIKGCSGAGPLEITMDTELAEKVIFLKDLLVKPFDNGLF